MPGKSQLSKPSCYWRKIAPHGKRKQTFSIVTRLPFSLCTKNIWKYPVGLANCLAGLKVCLIPIQPAHRLMPMQAAHWFCKRVVSSKVRVTQFSVSYNGWPGNYGKTRRHARQNPRQCRPAQCRGGCFLIATIPICRRCGLAIERFRDVDAV